MRKRKYLIPSKNEPSEYSPGRVCVFKDHSSVTRMDAYHLANIIFEERLSVLVKLKNDHTVRIGKLRLLLTYNPAIAYPTPNYFPPIGSKWLSDSHITADHRKEVSIVALIVDHPAVIVFSNSLGRDYAVLLTYFLREYKQQS